VGAGDAMGFTAGYSLFWTVKRKRVHSPAKFDEIVYYQLRVRGEKKKTELIN